MKNKVYTTATVITALAAAERGLGFLYRIVLSRLIGAEGLGLYQVSLSVFSLFLTIGTGGLPITLSRIIARHRADKNMRAEAQSVSAGLCITLFLTVPVFLILWLFAPKLHFLFTGGGTASVFRILLLGLCFSALYAVIKGSFWGKKEFLLPAIIDIAEETVMVLVGVLLLERVNSPLSGAEKAAWAVVISYLFSFALAFLFFLIKGGKFSTPKKQLKPLFNASLPITSVRACGSLVSSAVAILLPALLVRNGLSESDALKLFGIVSGMVLPILFIPSTVIGSLSLVLVPELSEDFYKNNQARLRKNILRGLRFSFLIACALIPFFYALGADVGRIAFSSHTAGEIIVKSCPMLLPMSLTLISTGILNSMGFEKRTFCHYFIGAAALLLCVLILPQFCGIYAYVIGLFCSYVINALFNLVFLYKQCPFFKKARGQVRVHRVIIALICVLPLSLFGQFIHTLSQGFFGEFFALPISALAIAVATALLYVLLGIFPIRRKKKALT